MKEEAKERRKATERKVEINMEERKGGMEEGRKEEI
jgi:hypothetical protein